MAGCGLVGKPETPFWVDSSREQVLLVETLLHDVTRRDTCWVRGCLANIVAYMTK